MVFWWFLLALPSLVFLVIFSIDVVREGYLIFGKLDLIVLLLAILYLVMMPTFVRHRRTAMGWLAVMLVTLASLVVAQGVATRVVVRPAVDAFPWPPMRRVQEISPALVGIEGPSLFTVNRFGLRGREVESIHRPGSILCVGGSTTESLYVTDEKSWPWRLGELLSQREKRSIFVGNAGRSGHLVKHHTYLIEHYSLIESFEWIIVLAGVNDLGALLHQNRPQREARVASETLFHRDRPNEASYRRLALWRWMEMALDVGTPIAAGQILQDPRGNWIVERRKERARKLRENPRLEPPFELEADLELYRQRLHELIQTARRKGCKILLLTQPTLWKEGLDPALEAMLIEQTDDAAYSAGTLAAMMDRYNQVLRDTAEQNHCPIVDLARRMPTDRTLFYDDCHFHDAGSAWVAEILIDRLASEFSSSASAKPNVDAEN
ncbi:SGNH/GDSL hydrolase family protein [bacterium]|nr:SGNH/GDSL hydrolase family protein [bacterium]